MHESSLARAILELALARTADAGGGRIVRVTGRIAETEALSREALSLNFAAQAVGTPAAGAELALALEHVKARCRGCETVYEPDHHVTLCPGCGSLDGEELGERGVWIAAIETAATIETAESG